MKIIGLTGGIACGKSTIAQMLRELGASVVDADAVSAQLTAPGGRALAPIREAFGDGVFFPDGAIDRRTLGAIVFSDAEALGRLNAATHPLIREKMLEEIETCRKMGASIVVLDVPLLFEAGFDDLADVTVCASAPEAVQIKRLKERNGLSREQALARIRSQWPLSEKERRCDAVIQTDVPLEELRARVRERYLAWCRPDSDVSDVSDV